MNKFKLFLENFLVYGFGGIISKLIPLIMVPIVTRIMPSTDYFGISDMSNTLVQFGSAIAIMGMYDAMYRMYFEKDEEDYKIVVCSTTLLFTIFASAIVFGAMIVLREPIASIFFSDKKYSYVVYISAIARKIYLITHAISPILSYSIAIPLLLAGHYVIALPIAAVISGITMELSFLVLNRKWFKPKLFDKKLLKQLLVIAVPLLPNFLIYWVFNSCDKVMITNMIGIGAAGIYSVGSKLGHASQLIYTAFAGGWQFFAFSTMREDNQVESNSRIFEYLGIISYVATAFICAWSYLIFKILFKVDYLSGYIVAPYLFLAPLLQMLFQVAANQFLVVKKTWPNLFILASGAVLNIIINYFLIPVLGIEGASLATLIGYIVSDVICVIVLCRMKLMVISNKFIFASLAMVAYMVIWRMCISDTVLIGTIAAIILTGMMVWLYGTDLKKLLQMIKQRKQVQN